MKVGLVGLGLVGGSMAVDLRRSGFGTHFTGVDANEHHATTAFELGLIDEVRSPVSDLSDMDFIVLATPVNTLPELAVKYLDMSGQAIVLDVGSTKAPLAAAIKTHRDRGRFVLTHPMAGTEFSGPEAAISDLFRDKCCVLCDPDDSDSGSLEGVNKLYETLGMRLIYLDSREHDVHAAYVSHISHISSFALALTVLAKEQDENQIFQLASGGFDTTVRLAKSSPDTWVPIFEQNRDNVLDVVDEHINQLARFRSLLIKRDFEGFYQLIREANDIIRILKS